MKKSQNLINESQELKQDCSEFVDFEIIKRAYTWGYPLILMDLTKNISTNTDGSIKSNALGKAPINQVARVRAFPGANFTSVVKPNVDTYYTTAWLNLKEGPLVLEVPTEISRYYLLPFLDAYSNIFKSLGTRKQHSIGKDCFITGPEWDGDVPEGFVHVNAPTNMVWMLGRIEVENFADGVKNVYPLQDQFRLVPYQYYRDDYTPPPGETNSKYDINNPVEYIENDMSVTDFFHKMAQLMNQNPPADYDKEILEEMKLIGIKCVDGRYQSDFSMDHYDASMQDKINNIPQNAGQHWEDWYSKNSPAEVKNNWSIQTQNKGSYGDQYEVRAYQAYTGLGANLPKDAIYPTLTTETIDQQKIKLNSGNRYQLTFPKDQLPPVHEESFWSLTAYNNNGYLVKNNLHRYSIGSTSPAIKASIDSGENITIYIQEDNPGKDKMPFWLPITRFPYDESNEPSATNCDFSLTLRLYWPKDRAFDWRPPALINLGPVEDNS